MRLVTWNSQPGIARKWETIQGFGADVLTVQECEPDTKAFVEGHARWTCEWQVGRRHNGVAVLARDPYRIGAGRQTSDQPLPACQQPRRLERLGHGDAH